MLTVWVGGGLANDDFKIPRIWGACPTPCTRKDLKVNFPGKSSLLKKPGGPPCEGRANGRDHNLKVKFEGQIIFELAPAGRPYNDRVAEYCIAATASLSMDATGAARLGNAGLSRTGYEIATGYEVAGNAYQSSRKKPTQPVDLFGRDPVQNLQHKTI